MPDLELTSSDMIAENVQYEMRNQRSITACRLLAAARRLYP